MAKTFEFAGYRKNVRRSALLLALVFLMPVYSSLANNVDGSSEEWSSQSLMATDNNGVSFLIDWDSDNLYLAWNGTDLSSNSEGADYSSILIQAKMVLLQVRDGTVSKRYHFPQILGLLLRIRLTPWSSHTVQVSGKM